MLQKNDLKHVKTHCHKHTVCLDLPGQLQQLPISFFHSQLLDPGRLKQHFHNNIPPGHRMTSNIGTITLADYKWLSTFNKSAADQTCYLRLSFSSSFWSFLLKIFIVQIIQVVFGLKDSLRMIGNNQAMHSYKKIYQLLKSPAMYLPDACGATVAAGCAGSSDLSQTGFFLRWSELCGHSFVQRFSLQQGFQTAAIQRAQHIFFQSQLQLSFGKIPFFNHLVI